MRGWKLTDHNFDHNRNRMRLETHQMDISFLPVIGLFLTISSDGGIAQLGERLNGIQEVSGSIPLISTKTKHRCYTSVFLFCVK